MKTRPVTDASAKICHVSVVVNASSAKTMISGTARAISSSDAASWLTIRAPTQRTIEVRP